MSDPLLTPFRAGASDPREGPATWCAIGLLVIAFVSCVVLTSMLLPRAEGGAVLRDPPVPMGSWRVAWGPGVSPPAAEQETRVRALRQVAAGVSGMLALLSLAIATGLWRQRLRLRRREYFVHWAVGARRAQLASRLMGQGSRWGPVILGLGVVISLALAPVLVLTFPGEAEVPPGLASALILFTAVAVVLVRWERRAGVRAARQVDDVLSRVLSGPELVAALGFATLTAVGLLTAHAPTSNPDDASSEIRVAGVSLENWGTDVHEGLEEVVTWAADASAAVGPLGVASAGSAHGAGVASHVWVDCGRCFEGGLPLPIRTVRAEVHAVGRDTFPHLGLQVVTASEFEDGDAEEAIVSQSMARRHFERGEAVGRQLRIGHDRWLTVVGIVSDRGDARDATEYAVYLPLLRAAPSELEVIGRTPERSMRAALATFPPGVRMDPPRTTSEIFAVHGWFGHLIESLGVLAYLLILLGVWFGRWHEMRALEFDVSLRKAMGARRLQLLLRFVLVTLRNVAIFVTAGVWTSLFFAKSLETAYGGIPGVDPAVWLLVGGPIVAAYVLGSWAPYARAMRMSPIVGLRSAE